MLMPRLSSITWERPEGERLKVRVQRNERFMICEKDLGYQAKGTEIEWVRAGWKSVESGFMKT